MWAGGSGITPAKGHKQAENNANEQQNKHLQAGGVQ